MSSTDNALKLATNVRETPSRWEHVHGAI